MTGLIFLCFVLFLVLCVWNIYLTMQLSKYKEIENSLVTIKQETEDVLYSFIEEWKEENDEFLNKLNNNSNNNKHEKKITSVKEPKTPVILPQQNRFDFVEKQTVIDYRNLLFNDDVNDHAKTKSNLQNPVISNDLKPFPSENFSKIDNKDDIMDKILLLKKDGHSIAEIAKKLDKGKTEIELMLKLRQ